MMIRWLLFLLLVPTFCNAQLINIFPSKNGKVVYEKILEIKGANKDRLYSNIKEWAIRAYPSQRSALETEDKQTGFIVYKGYLPMIEKFQGGLTKGSPYEVRIFHALKFYVKDEKVKVVMSDLEIQNMAITTVIANAQPEREPLERVVLTMDEKINNSSKRKADKWQQNAKEQYAAINEQITVFFNSLGNYLLSNKSGFDF